MLEKAAQTEKTFPNGPQKRSFMSIEFEDMGAV